MAVGIGLVFGVLRLVNFAYGQLIMAGAYALALTNGWSPVLTIVMCFAVVIGLTILMDLVVFRPLRERRAGDDADRDVRGLASSSTTSRCSSSRVQGKIGRRR